MSGAFSNVDRVLWPHAHFTKGQMLEYYEQIAPVLLPHIRGRPLTLRRFPHGVGEHGWYQTNCRGAPAWMRVAEVPGRGDALFRMCVVDDVRSLLWVVNLGTIELHPFLARADAPNEPDYVVFDLDPGPDAGLTEACAVAVRIRDLVTRALVKTSGSVGIHVYVPVAGRTFPETKSFAREVAERLERETPDLVTTRQARAARGAKVLVDWLQNDPSRSTVAPYSLRATAYPTVSTPVSWAELARPERLVFLPADVLARVERHGDLFV